MRNTLLTLAMSIAAPVSFANAQTDDGPTPDASKQGAPSLGNCNSMSGVNRSACIDRVKSATKENAAAAGGKGAKGTPGLSKADATLVNATNAAAQAKLDAKDYAGAAAEYQKGIDAAPNNPARHILYAGLAMALRREGVAAFNGGTRPTMPPSGASNDTIRAYNAAVAASQTERTTAALPFLKRAIEAGATAATLADASQNKAADAAISLELRESAGLLYRLDTRNTLTTARPSITLEADWLKRWLTATNPLAESLAAKYGIGIAANLTAKDPAAGLALADDIKARAGDDLDGAIGYAEIVVAARTPAGDPHRAKALAALAAVEPSIVDGQQKRRAAELKTALSAAS